jgi:hypothetical protein
MALDFPANPSDGEVYGSYVFSATTGVWKAREESAAPAVVSPVPPTTPNPGDIWVDSSDGVSYVYYNDGTSGQWIEMISSGVPQLNTKANLDGGNAFTGVQTLSTPLGISSGGTNASTVSTAQASLQIPTSPNYIINGGMDIWQRGTSGFTSGYCADRWIMNGANSAAISSDVPTGFRWSLSATNSSSTFCAISQRIESFNAVYLSQKTVTVSFWFKRTGTTPGVLQVNLDVPASTDSYTSASGIAALAVPNGNSPSTSWQRYSVTFPALSSTVEKGFQLTILHLSGGSAGNLGGLFTGVQLEHGSVATEFVRNSNSIQGELSACQRYLQVFRFSNTRGILMHLSPTSASGGYAPFKLMTTMRSNPTVTLNNINQVRYHVPGVIICGYTAFTVEPGVNQCMFGFSGGTAHTFGQITPVEWQYDSGILTFDAEL